MSGLSRVRPLETDQQQWERRAKALRLITHLRALLRYANTRAYIAELLCELVADVEHALRSWPGPSRATGMTIPRAR